MSAASRLSLRIEILLPPTGAVNALAIGAQSDQGSPEEFGRSSSIPANPPASTPTLLSDVSVRLWFYLQSDRSRVGPVSRDRLLELLEERILEGHTLVWSKGMAQWSAASSVPEIQSLLENLPPPIPPPEIVAPPAPPPLPMSLFSDPWPDHGIPWNPKIHYGVAVDPRDGRKYRTVKIGKQTWLAENLAFNAPGSWVYENKPENDAKYGRLYNWETATKAVPPGWHLPTDEEWMELEMAVGMNGAKAKDTGWRNISGEGNKLKSTKGWSVEVGLDQYGFRVLPAGGHFTVCTFSGLGSFGSFWLASPEGEPNALFRHFGCSDSGVGRDRGVHSSGYSVRLLKN